MALAWTDSCGNGLMCQILRCIFPKAQLQQDSVVRGQRGARNEALWCTQLLCAAVGGKATTTICQSSFWASPNYESLNIWLSHWGMYDSKQSPEPQAALSTGGPSSMPGLSGRSWSHFHFCQLLPYEGMTFRPSAAQLKLLGVARAFACSPSLRKKIHFNSVHLAV